MSKPPISSAGGAPDNSLSQRVGDLEQTISGLRNEIAEAARFSSQRNIMLEAMPAHVALIDPHGLILASNKTWTAYAAFSGYEPEPFGVGSNYLTALETNRLGMFDAASALAGIRSVIDGETDNFQLDHLCDTGSEKMWFHMVVTPVVLGTARGAIVTHRDVTAKMDALSQSLEYGLRLRLAVEAAAIGIWEYVPGQPVRWNERMYEIYGVPEGSEVLFEDWASLMHPADRETELQTLDIIRAAGGYREREFRAMTTTGLERHIQTVERATYRPDGSLERVLGTNVDVTERNRREVELRRANTRLQTLISEANVGIAVHQGSMLIMANPELARIFGYDSLEELRLNGDMRSMLTDADRGRFDASLRELMAGNWEPVLLRIAAQRRDGGPIDLESRQFAIDWDDGRSVCSMVTDVSGRRVMEAQLRESHKLEAIGQMTGGIAHDFNNLITVILGNGELLQAGLTDSPSLKSLADMTVLAAERGAELSSNLLAFARRQNLKPRPVAINGLIRAVMPLLRHAAGTQTEIVVDYEAEPWIALIDPHQLENALLNLCVNSRDAMPDGGTLTIRTSNRHYDRQNAVDAGIEPGSYVQITVSDTGTGMSAETRRRAFDLFFTTKDVGKGSGLGLSMVYGFVKQSSGNILIDSELGRGTCISLYLPRANEPELSPPSPEPVPQTVPRGGERVLLVEDDELVREQAIIQLTLLGYEVVSASNGKQALELLETAGEFDLLFTDIIMPGGMNGRQLADAAVELKPGLAVLFTSGYTYDAISNLAGGRISVPLLSKPYRQHKLAVMVREALDSRS